MIFMIPLICPAYSGTIRNAKKNTCLDCEGLVPKQAYCSAGSPSQTWTFSDGLLKCEESGKCLALVGTEFALQCAADDPNQKMKKDKAHRLKLLKKVGGRELCLSLYAGGRDAFEECHHKENFDPQDVYYE
jgi:hypothetical protein